MEEQHHHHSDKLQSRKKRVLGERHEVQTRPSQDCIQSCPSLDIQPLTHPPIHRSRQLCSASGESHPSLIAMTGVDLGPWIPNVACPTLFRGRARQWSIRQGRDIPHGSFFPSAPTMESAIHWLFF